MSDEDVVRWREERERKRKEVPIPLLTDEELDEMVSTGYVIPEKAEDL